jgi:D-alanyl-D-alanine carboxypeptidase
MGTEDFRFSQLVLYPSLVTERIQSSVSFGPSVGLCYGLFLFLFFAASPRLGAQDSRDSLDTVESSQVDEAVRAIMQRDDVPAISLAIVRHGQIAYLKAYGFARLPTDARRLEIAPSSRTASVSTRFAIGSVSKEFTAAAILLLADRGKLSLDDTVSKYLPDLTDANRVTIRELLSHTSGYRDYFLQEYIPARMQRPTSVDAILRTWAERPLDFPPGEEWQYSGTNYVVAGRIVERATSESYEKFLADDVLRPIGISDETFADHPSQPARNAVGYYRFALGPPRRAPITGRNWLFAMADLDMTAKDVALWDISVMNQSLLSAASYRAMSSDIKTINGRSTGYGLGFFVRSITGNDGNQHLMLHHPGEISGFRSHNFVLPDLKAAVVILTNAEYSDATKELAEQLQRTVGIKPTETSGADTAALSTPPAIMPKENPIEQRAHRIMLDLAEGSIDRDDLAPDASRTFTHQALNDIRQTLASLGDLERVRLDSTQLRGGTKHYALTLMYQHRQLQVAEYDLANGKIEQFLIDDKP